MKKFYYLLLCLLAYQVKAQNAKPFQPLSIGFTTTIESRFLHEERTINIYLPPSYREQDTTHYRVIYVPDGGIDEDFLHIAGLVQYAAQPWVGRLRPSIVIGIANTNRQRDFTFAVNNLDFLKKTGYTRADIPVYGGSSNYIAFLEKELMPFVNAHFKTDGHNTIIGESLAGLLVTQILMEHPATLDRFIIISPSLWWGDEQLLKLKLSGQPGAALVYIAAPRMSEDTMMYREAVELRKKIQATAGTKTHVYFDYLPAESHATVIHQAVYNAFKLFAKK